MAISEFELIKKYFGLKEADRQRPDLILGIGDDAAILAPRPNQELIVAVDTLVQGVHFPASMNPQDIGYRALAVNLSDLAAMGAEPAWFTLAITLPNADELWLEAFSRGMLELADQHKISLVGGDTTKGPLTISVQVMGFVEAGQALRRDGAKSGDLIYVTGYPGEAAAGLVAVLQDDSKLDDTLVQRFLTPQPRIELGVKLREVASAAIDISDGLLADIGHIAERSGLGANIDTKRLPLSAELLDRVGEEKAAQFALTGGDDYELCFCAPAEKAEQIAGLAAQSGIAINCIGQMEEAPGVRLYDAQGQLMQLKSTGYQHFGGKDERNE